MRLGAYLNRKLRERGWTGSEEADVADLVERIVALGYVDDRAFAKARAASLGRRGYGAARVGEALRVAGIAEDDGLEARAAAREGAWDAALRFAERRKIGPFALAEADRPAREKALAAMLRAGHPLDLARRLVSARPGEVPEPDAV
ncbi:regulatory protein RecX [Sphingosinicella sp. LHD-64]|uniref:regulatory protein RecX n=1 Tax=Sphingosinicella sp. LHD-64 TaxID=3072139 RepID=UPI0035BE49E0